MPNKLKNRVHTVAEDFLVVRAWRKRKEGSRPKITKMAEKRKKEGGGKKHEEKERREKLEEKRKKEGSFKAS